MPLTQKQIAADLDLDQSAVSRLLANLGIDWREVSLDNIRVAYLRKLRAEAAAHRSADGSDLVHERILTERIDRELKIFQLEQKKSQLINPVQLESEMRMMIDAFRTELLRRDDLLKADLDARYGIDIGIEILNGYVFDALKHLGHVNSANSGAD